MSNPFDEMRAAMSEARARIAAADEVASQMARLLVGRLRKVGSCSDLAALKKELRDYNIHTGNWKSE